MLKNNIFAVLLRGCGGIGRRARLRSSAARRGVRVPSPAQNKQT